MARIELAPEVVIDLDRFLDHSMVHDVGDAPRRLPAVIHSLDILAQSPLIGRLAKRGNRELIIGQGSHGYAALYRCVP